MTRITILTRASRVFPYAWLLLCLGWIVVATASHALIKYGGFALGAGRLLLNFLPKVSKFL
jgi:hypothetical protein